MLVSSCVASLCRAVINWARYYIYLSTAALFILGLVFSHSLVDNAVVSMFMSYLTDNWKKENLPKAAIIVNVEDGVSAIMVIIVAHISDAYIGRFKVTVYSTAAYIIGLLILSLSRNNQIFFLAAVLLAIGKAGRNPPLKAFLADQLTKHKQNMDIDEERVEAHTKFWWRVAGILGATISTLLVRERSLHYSSLQRKVAHIYIMKVGRWLSKLRHSAIDWISHRFFFSKAALFISGLVSSHGLVEYAVMGILIDYLAEYWKHSHLQGYAAVVNVQDAISATMAVVIAHISDAYVGRFKIVLFTNAAYLSAFVLLLLSTSRSPTPKNEVWILYPALFLAALGKAGREPSLKAFLADQLSERRLNLEIDEEQVEARRRVWWRVAWFLGAAMAVIFLANAPPNWKMIFKISTMVMGISYFLFVSGTTFYYCEKPSESPLRYVFRVFKAALAKRHLGYPQTASQFFKNDSDQLQLLPHIPLFRWLDKAAIVDTLLPEEQEKKGKLCTVAQVKEVKLLLNMVPLWITFLAYSLIVAAGTTFFYAQGSNMDNRVGDQFTVPLIYFYVIRCMLNFIIYILYVPLVPKKWTDTKKRKAAQVRIALGLICSILCCSTAAVVEAHRLSLVSHLDDPSETIPMSILWLAPQFCLLGLMEGFAESGLYEFFYEMVAKSMEKYGPSFNTCVVGIGGCLSIPMVFICDSWFGDTINNSRLDLYYTVLAIISFLNLCFYWCVSRKCIYKDDDQDTIVEDSFVRLLTKSFSTGTHPGHHSSSSEIMCSSSTTTGRVICKRANSYR